MRYIYIFLLLIGVAIIIVGLLSFTGKKQVFPTVAQHKTPVPTIAQRVTPTAIPHASFLYYDQTPVYSSLYIVDPATGEKQGVYGATVNEVFEDFILYNQQLYIKGNLSFGILNLVTHYFYHIDQSQIPLTASPDQSKAVYLEDSANSLQFKITQSNKKDVLIPSSQQGGIVYKPLCWVNNNTAVILKFQNQLFTLDVRKKTFTPDYQSPQQTQAVSIYCNSNTNTLYFLTKSALFSQPVQSMTVTQVPNTNQLPNAISNLVFPYNSTQQVALVAIGSTLLKLNLTNGMQQTVYTASQSATVTPFLWDSPYIIFTTQGENDQGQSYTSGTIMNQKNKQTTIFVSHQSTTIPQIGSIIPITWLPVSFSTFQ